MLNEPDNEAYNAEISKYKLKQWIGIENINTNSINNSALNNDNAFNKVYEAKQEKIQDKRTHNFNEVNDKIDLHKGSFAHNLHPNIEALAHSLINKIDTLQQTQLDIHHVEIITDRAFHGIEKLKYEIKEVNDYIEKIESRNKNLETKIDLLITQNIAINKQNIQLQNMCERFFSHNSSRVSVGIESQLKTEEINTNKVEKFLDVNYQENPKITNITENVAYNAPNNDKTSNIDVPELNNSKTKIEQVLKSENIAHNKEVKKTGNIKDLLHSKKQIESFIKKNYPDDYIKMKQYNRANIFNWVNRVLGFN